MMENCSTKETCKKRMIKPLLAHLGSIGIPSCWKLQWSGSIRYTRLFCSKNNGSTTSSLLTATLASKFSDGTMGIAPPFFPNLRSKDLCTLSVIRQNQHNDRLWKSLQLCILMWLYHGLHGDSVKFAASDWEVKWETALNKKQEDSGEAINQKKFAQIVKHLISHYKKQSYNYKKTQVTEISSTSMLYSSSLCASPDTNFSISILFQAMS